MIDNAEFEMDSLANLEKRAIRLLQAYQPKDRPYWGCFSGGKDSVVIKALAEMAGVSVVWHYNVTTIDPPELVRFIKREHPDVIFDRPKENFWSVARRKGFPTRRMRWCCDVFKHTRTPKGETVILGVRSAESDARNKFWSSCDPRFSRGVTELAIILNWRDEDVWQFIRKHSVKYCSLYDEGFERLGCVDCPKAQRKAREKERRRWPQFELMWRKLFRDIWIKMAGTKQRNGKEWFGSHYFSSADELYEWWKTGDALPDEPKRKDFFGRFDQS